MMDGGPSGVRRDDGLWRVADCCRLAVDRTGVDGMAVSVADESGSIEPLLGTDAVADKVADLQYVLGEGPGVDAVKSREPVMVADLASVGARQWPAFIPEAAALGIGALHAFPLTSGAIAFGTALLYRREPGALDEMQVRQAVSVSELLTMALVEPGASVGAGLRMSVHQAAGMVMQQTGGSIGDALVMLKATAFGENRAITDLAAEVLAGVRRFHPTTASDGEMP